MRTLCPSVGLGTLCRLFGISRQAYYESIKRSMRKELRNEQVLTMVRTLRLTHPRMGTRKIYNVLQAEMELQGILIGRDQLFELLADNQMLIRNTKRKVRTTLSNHPFYKYTNLIKDFIPYKRNQIWVSDITYIRVGQHYSYLFLITDAYSRKIVGYRLSKDLRSKHATKALSHAIGSKTDLEGLIHHSDRGIQYCSHEYVKLCQDYGIRLSMSEVGNPLENAIAERINGILKQEYLSKSKAQNYDSLKKSVDHAVYKYNTLRPHMSCNMKTPNQAHQCSGLLKKQWKNYYLTKTS